MGVGACGLRFGLLVNREVYRSDSGRAMPDWTQRLVLAGSVAPGDNAETRHRNPPE
jgi:hypothetical protein